MREDFPKKKVEIEIPDYSNMNNSEFIKKGMELFEESMSEIMRLHNIETKTESHYMRMAACYLEAAEIMRVGEFFGKNMKKWEDISNEK